MSRIAPLEPPYAPEIQAQFGRIMRGAPPLTLFRVMAGNARAWEKFRAGSLLDRGPLSLREREIVIDRTCALTGCEYEWGVHIAIFAAAAGFSEEQIRALRLDGADAPCWSATEQALKSFGHFKTKACIKESMSTWSVRFAKFSKTEIA